jgi:hypothetical protein
VWRKLVPATLVENKLNYKCVTLYLIYYYYYYYYRPIDKTNCEKTTKPTTDTVSLIQALVIYYNVVTLIIELRIEL